MFSWFTGKKSEAGKRLVEMLSPGSVVILSAKCCNPMAGPADEALTAKLKAACAETGVDAQIIRVETVTEAQSALPSVAKELDARQLALTQKLTTLFMTQGLGVFPMLIIDGEMAFYGGVPEVAQIREKLQAMQAKTVGVNKPLAATSTRA